MATLNSCKGCGTAADFAKEGSGGNERVQARCTNPECGLQTPFFAVSLEYAAMDKAAAIWNASSADEWPMWIQPTGAHDAYSKGAKVTHKDKHWISNVDANVWEPGASGWTLQGGTA